MVDVINGARLGTYAIPGDVGTDMIQMYGAAALLVLVGDLVIIMSYVQVEDPVQSDWKPRVVLADEQNRPREIA